MFFINLRTNTIQMIPFNKLTRRYFVQLSVLAGLGLSVGCKEEVPDPIDDEDDGQNPMDEDDGQEPMDEDDGEEPTDEDDEQEPNPEDIYEDYTPAIVIGSGFGGAVSALRLGEAGVETIVLERGKKWVIDPSGNTFSPLAIPDNRSTWLGLESIAPIGIDVEFEQKHVGVLERIRFQGMDVYGGACVGGGSVVYGGITVEPDSTLFQQVFPPEISLDELKATYFPRVRQMLGAEPIHDDLLNGSPYFQFVRTSVEHAENIGLPIEYFPSVYDWNIIKDEINGDAIAAAIDGEILYGVNSGAKKSLDYNYLPAAEATGNVTIHALHQVKDMEQLEDGIYKINVEVIDEMGNVVEEKVLHCKYLFMGAGSVGTTRLLVRSKEKGLLPNINETLGQGWGSNGATMGARSGLTQDTGAKQSSPSSSAAYDFSNGIAPTVLDMANFPTGFECHCLIYLGLALDDNRGYFEYDPVTEDINLNWTNNGVPKAALEDVFARLNTENGGENGNFLLPEIKDNLTYHPLGGAVMGETCDFFGRVKNYDNLYVMDGALIPGSSACANPSLTIAGIAERNIETILEEDILI